MFKRCENGKLKVDLLDLEVEVAEMFDVCKTENELDFVKETIDAVVEKIYYEYEESLG